MTITHYPDLLQISEEWFAARCGMLTASEMKHIITPTGKPAKNEKMRAHAYELLAQRLTGYVEPAYVSDDMLRGHEDEIDARLLYSQKYAPVQEMGFIVRDFGDFKIGYSPDGLVGDDGLIEIKSRRQKLQVQTIVDGEVPGEHDAQIQTGLLVSGRKWCDYVSYSAGLPMAVFRVEADEDMQAAILAAAEAFEDFIDCATSLYHGEVRSRRFHPTARKTETEMVI
ncbi:MAG: YqaJ viral recombinase family protein [Acidobacteria bacterium]|nr:YqaJ viral recombinase family protein [Acidobacteriota bacterium]